MPMKFPDTSLTSFAEDYILLKICLCVYLCALRCMKGVRGQFARVSCLLLLCGSPGIHLRHLDLVLITFIC